MSKSVKNPHRKNPWASHFQKTRELRKQAPSLELMRKLKQQRENLLKELEQDVQENMILEKSPIQENLFAHLENTFPAETRLHSR